MVGCASWSSKAGSAGGKHLARAAERGRAASLGERRLIIEPECAWTCRSAGRLQGEELRRVR